MSTRIALYTLSLILSATFAIAQEILHVDPPNWWTGMKHNHIQIMFHGDQINQYKLSVDHDHVVLDSVVIADSPNYLLAYITLGTDLEAADIQFTFQQEDYSFTYDYIILPNDPTAIDGFTSADAIYLITPDRYTNGNPSNDNIVGMRELANRSDKGGRHGGDIAGMISALDYISDMGFTAIWLNPVLENDMEQYSYHGYSITDFYKVDARYGSNQDYRKLADEARKKDVKLIMDMIVNHCGSYHWWTDDLPFQDWYNQWESYTGTNHQKTVIQDPYVSAYDKKQFTDGWFVPTMPDLNQRNPYMATYLIQNSIWWVEYLGLSGIRMDTYPYPNEDFMSRWTSAMMLEYPTLNIVGEEWNLDPAIVSYWQKGKINSNGYTSELKSLMDFPGNHMMIQALSQEESWSGGLKRLYEITAKDFLYADPMNLVTFPDNHDMARIWALLNHDLAKWKMAIVHILTHRGIPQIYYGTEVLADSPPHRDDGAVRSDFPGGWVGDKVNAFTGEGLSDIQREAQAFLKKILHWRQTASVIHHGRLKHFLPDEGVYLTCRYDEKATVVTIFNKGDKTSLDTDKYMEILEGYGSAIDIITGQTQAIDDTLQITPRNVMILELR